MDAALRYLFVPGALRTLAPPARLAAAADLRGDGQLLNNPLEPYWGRYQGDEDTRRKPAYHNGTAWTWTLPDGLRSAGHGVGRLAGGGGGRQSLSGQHGQTAIDELPGPASGNPRRRRAPHARGCDAQAWSVTEALRVWKWLQKPKTAPASL